MRRSQVRLLSPAPLQVFQAASGRRTNTPDEPRPVRGSSFVGQAPRFWLRPNATPGERRAFAGCRGGSVTPGREAAAEPRPGTGSEGVLGAEHEAVAIIVADAVGGVVGLGLDVDAAQLDVLVGIPVDAE